MHTVNTYINTFPLRHRRRCTQQSLQIKIQKACREFDPGRLFKIQMINILFDCYIAIRATLKSDCYILTTNINISAFAVFSSRN